MLTFGGLAFYELEGLQGQGKQNLLFFLLSILVVNAYESV